jgi:hypothetical protein
VTREPTTDSRLRIVGIDDAALVTEPDHQLLPCAILAGADAFQNVESSGADMGFSTTWALAGTDLLL